MPTSSKRCSAAWRIRVFVVSTRGSFYRGGGRSRCALWDVARRGARTLERWARVVMTDDASTILVVEDDDATRTYLADNLSADGYVLLTADCARDGWRLLETKFPDLVLVDVALPDGSGLELIRRVRAADGVASRVDPATPILVVSGRRGELDRLRGFERGADDYLV